MKIPNLKDKVKRTKIITTIGPSTHDKDSIRKLFEAGMTTIRLNFSHGDYEEHGSRIQNAKELTQELQKPVSILLDTKGPEIRVGQMKDGQQEIVAGSTVTIYTLEKDYQTKQGTANEITVSYDMSQDLKKGDTVLLDDGKLNLTVESVSPGVVVTKAFNHHLLKTNKRINLPGIAFSMPFLAQKDIDDIKYGCKQEIDYIAASFVNTEEDVEQIRQILKEQKSEHVQIISKIESQLGIDNIDSIINASDGIMIARGDLGLEIPYYEVPYWEKVIIRKCREKGKIVVVATQMLESMTDNPAPTRAEVTDVYLATELGADATMLSGESAAGSYPFIATATMAMINKRAEIEFYDKLYYEQNWANARKSTSGKRADIADQLTSISKDGKYEYAIVLSRTGALLKTISKFRPNVTILGVSENPKLYTAFGVWHSIFMNQTKNFPELAENEVELSTIAKHWGAKAGEKVLVVRNENITEITVK